MANAVATQCVVLKNSSLLCMARVESWAGAYITQATISSATYTVYLLDADYPENPDTRTAVTGHEDEALTVADLIFDTLQTAAPWDTDIDATGYNLKHQIDVLTNQAFGTAGRRYLVVFTLTPVSGQKILVAFEARII